MCIELSSWVRLCRLVFAMIGKPEILCDAYLLRERESVACILLLALHSPFVCMNQLFRVLWSLLPGLALGCLSDLCSCRLLDVLDMMTQSVFAPTLPELLSQAPALALRITLSCIPCRFGFVVGSAM